MNTTQALQAIKLLNTGYSIRPEQVADMLKDVRGATFASIVQVTPVVLAAKHKALCIEKVTGASVQLFNNVSEFTSVWANAVKRSATKVGNSAAEDIADFVPKAAWYDHTDCYSIVKHKTKEQYYLYAIYNKGAKSVYIMDGRELSKEEVAAFMTPAAARDLLEPSTTTLNVGANVEHSAIVRATALVNVVSIIAQKQLIIV